MCKSYVGGAQKGTSGGVKSSVAERLQAGIRHEGGCWIWIRSRKPSGYGQLTVDGKVQYAHRIAYQTWVGSIPEGDCVLHNCDNRPCINPKHLFLGSKLDNSNDMVRKGRGANQHTRRPPKSCTQGHRFTPGNTRVDKHGWRSCRRCHNERNREYMRRKYRGGESMNCVKRTREGHRCTSVGQYRIGADAVLCQPCWGRVRAMLAEVWGCEIEEVAP